MGFYVHGHCFTEIQSMAFAVEPALGFNRLVFDLTLAVRERRHEGMPTLTELTGELFVRDADDGVHYLGKVAPAAGPVRVTVNDHSPAVRLDLELSHDRLDALEAVRRGDGLTFDLSLRGRVQFGQDCCLVADQITHAVESEAWERDLERLRQGAEVSAS